MTASRRCAGGDRAGRRSPPPRRPAPPAGRRCEKSLSTIMLEMTAMRTAPPAERSGEPRPPWIAVPPTRTAAITSMVRPGKDTAVAWPKAAPLRMPAMARPTEKIAKARMVTRVKEMPLISAVARLAPISVVSRPATVRCMTNDDQRGEERRRSAPRRACRRPMPAPQSMALSPARTMPPRGQLRDDAEDDRAGGERGDDRVEAGGDDRALEHADGDEQQR